MGGGSLTLTQERFCRPCPKQDLLRLLMGIIKLALEIFTPRKYFPGLLAKNSMGSNGLNEHSVSPSFLSFALDVQTHLEYLDKVALSSCTFVVGR